MSKLHVGDRVVRNLDSLIGTWKRHYKYINGEGVVVNVRNDRSAYIRWDEGDLEGNYSIERLLLAEPKLSKETFSID